MKILFLDRPACKDDISYGELFSFGEVFDAGMVKTEERFLEILDETEYSSCEVLFCNKAPVTARVMEKMPRLRYVGVFATGYNNIDVGEAHARGITVTNVPGYSTDAVAQLVFALILEISVNTGKYTEDTRRGDWTRYPIFSMLTHDIVELRGKTLGVLGYGNIGKKVAAIGNAFGMRVIVCTRTERPGCPYPYVSRDELLRESDYLSLNAPLNEGTARFIDDRSLEKMKKSAVLINTARGGLVDEEALARALKSGALRAAGLDVLNKEPMSPDCPLLGLPNCFITPHIGWAPYETRQRLVKTVAENLRAFLAGTPVNTV
ncbi:MAG: D-2-hydroxyacid dehydrogenase [Clostridia bacterium]|nr:D-2-hydroxyacid dehydrogenase [Clostridia bacterium]